MNGQKGQDEPHRTIEKQNPEHPVIY